MPGNRVMVVGSVNTDLVIRGRRLPRPGETILGGSFYQAAGGKGANQAVGAARAAVQPVTFLAAVGDDDFGSTALAGFRRENLDTAAIRVVAGAATGVALILVDEHGQNMISVASGANLALAPADVDALPATSFDACRVLLASLEVPLETVAAAIRRGRTAGLMVVVNPAPAALPIAEPELLHAIDVLTPNCGEAAALAGLPVPEGDDLAVARAAAERLHRRGARQVVVTLGRLGVLVYDGQALHLPAPEVRAIDATAAGDAFNGALAVALSEGAELVAAARWACRAAAISVTRAGAQPSLPTRIEIEAFSGT
ncbi:MAG: ribokinase [Pirellulales bacterium]|nr:ribokinase [Pirellulales bacterium]